jgi:putative membrane protein
LQALLQGRLHPASLLFNIGPALWNLALGLGLWLLLKKPSGPVYFLLFFAVVRLIISVTQFLSFRYRIQEGELVTQSGILHRQERHIALSRIQDVRVEQGPLHRLLKVAVVHVETAGGKGTEASFNVVSLNEAEHLRAALGRLAHPVVSEQRADGTPVSPVVEEVPEVVLREVSTRELILAGLTTNYLARVIPFVLAAFSQLDDLIDKGVLARFLRRTFRLLYHWWEAGGTGAVAAAIVAGIGLVLLALVASAVGSILLYAGFRLTLRGEDVHRSYGLLTRRAGSLARRRIQVVQIEESLLRRLLGLATLRADTAGSVARGENGAGRDVLLPIIPRADLDPLLPKLLPDLDGMDRTYQHVAKVAIRRNALPGIYLLIVLTGILYWFRRDAWVLIPLLLAPIVVAVSVIAYRHLGYRRGERYLWTRQGWLDRSTNIVPLRNAQSIVLRQSPFDRRSHVATVHVDTAGQTYTGGGPRIANLPFSEAVALSRWMAGRAEELRKVRRMPAKVLASSDKGSVPVSDSSDILQATTIL